MQTASRVCEPVEKIGFPGRERYNGGVSDDVIRHKLTTAGIRPKDLARATGLSKQQASMMLKGTRGINRKHFPGIARLLGISEPELLTDSDLPRHKIGVDSTSNPFQLSLGEVRPHAASSVAADPPSAVVYDFDVAARLIELANELRALAGTIAARQATAISLLAAGHVDRPRTRHRRPAR